MDRIPEDWKKYPLVLIGSLPAIPPGALCLSPSALGAPGSPLLHDFYLVIGVPASELAATLIAAQASGAEPDQVVVYGNAGDCTGGFGVLDAVPDETAEELRARLLLKLQARRQLRLSAAFHAARRDGIELRLSGDQLSNALDVTRIAHALCCAYSLAPGLHSRLLRGCLQGEPIRTAWTAEAPPEHLIPETAALVHQALLRGTPLREALREKTAGLSYRARNELLHHVENCVGALTGNGKHAA